MSQVTLYTSQHCPYWRMAEQLLARRDAGPLNRIRVDLDPQALRTMNDCQPAEKRSDQRLLKAHSGRHCSCNKAPRQISN